MSAAALPPDEEERLKALDAYAILDTLAEEEYDEIVKLASAICDTPVALISLVDRNRQWFKAKTGTGISETPREQSFCAHGILDPENTLVVPDARVDRRFADNPLVTGDPHIVFYAGVPLISPEGQPIGSVCVIDHKIHQPNPAQLEALRTLSRQVITRLELKRKMRELEAANAALLESNVIIQKFARTAAHDIKNPLTSIQLNSQLMERTLPDGKAKELAAKNVQACKELITLVNDMLGFARSTSLTEYREIELNPLLEKVTGLMNLPEHIEISLPDPGCKLQSAPVALEQVFLNLLSNAVRYNDKLQTRIRIQFREMDAYYELKVSDNGIGIHPQHLEQIFEERFTAGLADRFDQKGTGIGLYTVRKLIDKLNGRIYAESVPGKSTVFHISLPKIA